jgi:hypothetical protein
MMRHAQFCYKRLHCCFETVRGCSLWGPFSCTRFCASGRLWQSGTRSQRPTVSCKASASAGNAARGRTDGSQRAKGRPPDGVDSSGGRSASQTVQLAQYCRIATLWRVLRGNGCVQSAIDRASALQRPRCMRGRGMVFDVSQYDREALGDMGEDSPARS